MNGISNATSTLLAGLNGKGHAAGTTQAAVSAGNITVRDGEKQQQDMTTLSRDTEHANDSISPIFDKEKEQKRLQAAQLAGELSGQIAEIVRTAGDIKGLKAAGNDNPLPENATEQQRQDWLKALRASDKYQETMKLYGTGSTLQMAAQSVSGVVAGLAVGNLKQAIADGMSPAMAQLIKAGTTDANGKVNEAANTLAHALWGGIAAEVASGNAAAGAASGELAARYIAKNYYGADTQEKVDALNESDRQMLSMLGTIAAGIAGGVVADNQAGTTTAAKAGKNAVENNGLSFGNGFESNAAAATSWNKYAVDNNLSPEETQAGLDKIAKGDMPDSTNITKVIVDGSSKGVMIAGAFYMAPEVAIAKGISGALVSGGINTAYQYVNMKPGDEFSYYNAATATATGYLSPGYNIPTNIFISSGGAFLTDGVDPASLGGAAVGSLTGGVVGKYAPIILRPILGPSSGFWAETGGAFASEVSGDAVHKAISKVGEKK